MNWLWIDLGKKRDYAAIGGVIEYDIPYAGMRQALAQGRAEPMVTSVYELRGLSEHIGMPYPKLARMVKQLARRPETVGDLITVVDATGVGEAFCDMLQDSLIVDPGTPPFSLFPIRINVTGGDNVNITPTAYNVPKTHIVDALVSVFETERINLHTPEEMPLVAELRKQLEHFTTKPTKTGQTASSDDDSVHDDLVMMLATGLWYAESLKGGQPTKALRPPRSAQPYDPRNWGRTR